MPRGRPRLYNTDEERKAARARYTNAWKAKNYSRQDWKHEAPVSRSAAIYDPQRDGPALILSLTALICGDPPLGRSALDRQTSGSK